MFLCVLALLSSFRTSRLLKCTTWIWMPVSLADSHIVKQVQQKCCLQLEHFMCMQPSFISILHPHLGQSRTMPLFSSFHFPKAASFFKDRLFCC